MLEGMLEAFDESVQMERLTASSKRKSLVGDPDTNNDDRQSTAVGSTSSGSRNVEIRILEAEEKTFAGACTNSESVARIRKVIEETNEPMTEPLSPNSKWKQRSESCCAIN